MSGKTNRKNNVKYLFVYSKIVCINVSIKAEISCRLVGESQIQCIFLNIQFYIE